MRASWNMIENQKKFWNRVIVVDGGCWQWTGSVGPTGYGQTSVPGLHKFKMYVHRLAYVYENGFIDDELTIDHLCKNRSCVNPSHLEMVPFLENLRRGDSPWMINARKKNCHRGHFLSGKNLIKNKDGSRNCRACRNILQNERYQKNKTHCHVGHSFADSGNMTGECGRRICGICLQMRRVTNELL